MIPFPGGTAPTDPPGGQPRLTVIVPAAVADLVAAFLHLHAEAEGLEVRDAETGGPQPAPGMAADAVALVVWPSAAATADLVFRLRALFGALREGGALDGRTHVALEEDPGLWERPRQVVRIAGRFVIARPWVPYQPEEGEIALELEPGPDEDDGRHPDTALALLLLHRLERTGHAITAALDVRCGNGVLALAMARVWPDATVLAVDDDPVAVAVARENIARAGLGDRVRVRQGEAPPTWPAAAFDVATVRGSASRQRALGPHVAAALRPGGHLVASGFPRGAVDGVERTLVASGLFGVRSDSLEDWAGLLLVK